MTAARRHELPDGRTAVISWDGRFTIEPNVAGMLAPYRCLRCSHVHDAGKVTITARYADCSMWRCPNCNAQLDSRGGGWGGTERLGRL